MIILDLIIALLAIVLFAQALLSIYMMLYSWEHPERLEQSAGPQTFRDPGLSFSVLLPARHEEQVIFQTIKRLLDADYPQQLLDVMVICHVDDTGTIAEAQRAIDTLQAANVRVATFADAPINKPHGLNVGLRHTHNDVVTVFDAEDDIDPSIFRMINTVMLDEQVGVVQAGVQLMNFRDHWFSMHNCLEYFFWFKSRLHFHARVGMIPLGGNTVFIRRPLLDGLGGWDDQCLTEDADIGVRLSALGVPIRVVYDARRVTREETPESVVAFIKQRTRWHQGYLQILRRGLWRSLPQFSQRLLALYTLAYPLMQAALVFLWPLTIVEFFVLKLPVALVILAFLPLYALVAQLIVCVLGAYSFTREFGLRLPPRLVPEMAMTFLPFQLLMGISAVRAVVREMRRESNWEKTAHVGAHRVPQLRWSVAFQQVLDEAGVRLGVERSSVLILDPAAQTLSVLASRGLPEQLHIPRSLVERSEITELLRTTTGPVMLNLHEALPDLAHALQLPAMSSALLIPVLRQGTTLGLISFASAPAALSEDAVDWLHDRIQQVLGDAVATPAVRIA